MKVVSCCAVMRSCVVGMQVVNTAKRNIGGMTVWRFFVSKVNLVSVIYLVHTAAHNVVLAECAYMIIYKNTHIYIYIHSYPLTQFYFVKKSSNTFTSMGILKVITITLRMDWSSKSL